MKLKTLLLFITLLSVLTINAQYTHDVRNWVLDAPDADDLQIRFLNESDPVPYIAIRIDSMNHTIIYTDTVTFPGTLILGGTGSQYIKGDGSKATFPTIPSNTNQLTNGSGFITSEVDGSITNEIELPSQTSNLGKFLNTNGTNPSWEIIPNELTHYNASGVLSVTKRWIETVTPSTGNGYSIDISSAGFTNVLGVSIISIKNTSTPTSVPKVSIKSITSTAVVVNIIEGNATLQLGLLLGTSEQFVNTSGLTLMVIVEGN